MMRWQLTKTFLPSRRPLRLGKVERRLEPRFMLSSGDELHPLAEDFNRMSEPRQQNAQLGQFSSTLPGSGSVPNDLHLCRWFYHHIQIEICASAWVRLAFPGAPPPGLQPVSKN